MVSLLRNMKMYIVLLTSMFVFSSCSKDDLMVCGTITSGESEFNQIANQWYFYLYLDGKSQRVDELTYNSYYVGDYICLE